MSGRKEVMVGRDVVAAVAVVAQMEVTAELPAAVGAALPPFWSPNMARVLPAPPPELLLLTQSFLLDFEWLLKIGDDLAGDTTDGELIVHIPSDILMLSNLSIENYFKDRAILAPTLDCVTDVNNKMTAGLPRHERDYLSSDFVCAEEENIEFELDAFLLKILNGINYSGLPPHKLIVKVGAPVMLLLNIDQTNSLCNRTRMQVRRMGNHVIECKTLIGNKAESIVLIPRLNLIPNNKTLLVRFQRRQFSIIMSFAMTINKSQGETLSKVGIYLPRPFFTHGQLYVALSRVTTKDGLRVLLQNYGHLEDNYTMNVVYREVFENL
ncbi:uncharacterized protein [Arachis hypogaea]|uniref:uncharacterized protein n=1 Tax=Arachis hypogaea TaxID=3818 RepID=UPI000DEC9965